MKVCIKGKIINANYHLVYGEQKAVEQGYTIFEVPQGYEDCAFEDFDENGFNVELYNKRQQGYENKNKIHELKQKLYNTDYVANKLSEAIATSFVTEDNSSVIALRNKYFNILADRDAWREEINRLEEELNNGNNGQ